MLQSIQASFSDLKMHSNICYTLDSFFGWPDEESLEPKHVAVSIILYNKLLCLSETYLLCESDKHSGIASVRRNYYRYLMCRKRFV